MENPSTPKRLVTGIEAYRAAKKAGRIRIIPTSDNFGNSLLAIEQDITDPFTEERSINVLGNINTENIRKGREHLEKMMNEGDNNIPNELGVQQLLKNAESSRKQAEESTRQAEARKLAFQDRLADMDAMLADALAVEEKAKADYEARLAEDSEAVKKMIADKSKKAV